jgi:hypothetical protein
MRAHVWAAAMTIAALNPAYAQQEPGWIADKSGCRVWNSSPGAGETMTWSGPCKDGLANGYGTVVWLVGRQLDEAYVGVLVNGHYTGYGIQIWRDGSSYTGNYLDDRASGWGTYRNPDGEIFSGNWVNGCLKHDAQRFAVGVPISECD